MLKKFKCPKCNYTVVLDYYAKSPEEYIHPRCPICTKPGIIVFMKVIT